MVYTWNVGYMYTCNDPYTVYAFCGAFCTLVITSTSLLNAFIADHIPPISEVINGDTKIVTEFKRNEEGKLLKVRP